MPLFPFENAGRQAIVQEDPEKVPNAYVSSCSECCFEKGPDGGPNILGMLQRQSMTRVIDSIHGHFEYLDCGRCPVPAYKNQLPAKTGDGKYIYWKGTGRRLTRGELLNLELDGDPVGLYCDFREE